MVRAKVSGGVCRLRAMLPYLNCGIASFSSLFLLLAICVAAVPVKAANSHGQLVMITTSHCPWCEAFEDEVGAGYDRTEEALTYPLRRHDFYHAMPDDLAHLTPATMTPTFIVMRDGMGWRLAGSLAIRAPSYFGGGFLNLPRNDDFVTR